MRKITFLTLLLLASYGLFSQTTKVDYYKWSDPTTYKLSPSPIIKGYGYYSDSLSEIFEGKTFFEHNNEYFCIESWADYYYWFIKEYTNIFEDPQLYEYYYWANDDYGMTSYIASNKYFGKYYPSSIQISFGDDDIENNRLNTSTYNTKKDDEKVEFLNKQLQNTSSKKISKDNEFNSKNTNAEIFQKDDFRKNDLKNYKQKTERNEKTNSTVTKKNIK